MRDCEVRTESQGNEPRHIQMPRAGSVSRQAEGYVLQRGVRLYGWRSGEGVWAARFRSRSGCVRSSV